MAESPHTLGNSLTEWSRDPGQVAYHVTGRCSRCGVDWSASGATWGEARGRLYEVMGQTACETLEEVEARAPTLAAIHDYVYAVVADLETLTGKEPE